ncbi:hypothetical protein GOP47_0001057 [Adiantum capillus-veneris]|uniref:Uncharacterized protein n=1 Tax=Adiantum capillus-veneris TaxID=13818 RepID=A0A9D4VG54_ADICA|nr:hypothetical protein GOP47_0030738 [Adiantum capillus-veneris]KAI5054394.1 hypothetical protein GOP47_0030756 [Adiantum capillus-veneris]KAI5084010.1 hypothetical protein GOP47_0000179 [Adiantum capillus-veneris]KAI5084888.1 hypothetical protein GOP47_0001057 [Adiantum capillus-veneris]
MFSWSCPSLCYGFADDFASGMLLLYIRGFVVRAVLLGVDGGRQPWCCSGESVMRTYIFLLVPSMGFDVYLEGFFILGISGFDIPCNYNIPRIYLQHILGMLTFRWHGYQAWHALRALKGLVKLQAFMRGHIVRKQAAITLRCMQVLVRVQARVRACRVRMSEEDQAVQRQLFYRRQQESRPRRSMDRWIGNSGAAEQLNNRQEGSNHASKRDRNTNGGSEQLWKGLPKQNSMVIDGEPDKNHWGWTWLDRWMAARPWEIPIFDELMNGMMECRLK